MSTEESSNLARVTVAEPCLNPGSLALLSVFKHYVILFPSLKCAVQNSEFFNIEACLCDLRIGKDFFQE